MFAGPLPLPRRAARAGRSTVGGDGGAGVEGGGSRDERGGGARGGGGSAGGARERPLQLVARRNARERRRVQAVNGAFGRLRRAVPTHDNRGKRVSKVKTLHRAIEYIQQLQRLLVTHNEVQAMSTGVTGVMEPSAVTAQGAIVHPIDHPIAHPMPNGRQGLRSEIIGSPDRNKENSAEIGNRWISYEMTIRPVSCGPDSLAQLLSEFQDF